MNLSNSNAEDRQPSNVTSYDAALTYLAAGIGSTFPLVPGDKNPMVAGFHGMKGDPPASWDKRQHDTWLAGGKHAASTNLGWRLTCEIGIDVDEGVKNFADAQALLGPLPAGPSSTARGADSHRRTHIFRVPVDRVRPGVNPRRRLYELLGVTADDLKIDIIHRYTQLVAVWPSVHHSGRRYRWYDADGVALDEGQVPRLGDFPALPEAWLDALLPLDDKGVQGVALRAQKSAAPERDPGDPFSDPSTHAFTRDQAESRFIGPALADLAASTVGHINIALNNARMTLSHFVGRAGEDIGFGDADEFNERLRDALGKTAYDGGRMRSWRFEDNEKALIEGPAVDDWRATFVEAVDDPFAQNSIPVTERTDCVTAARAEDEEWGPFSPLVNVDESDTVALVIPLPTAKVEVAPPVMDATAEADKPARFVPPTLPLEFYDRRPWLKQLQTSAYKRRAAPDGVLGVYLAIAASQIPADIQLNTGILSPLTATLFCNLVGPSGRGKTASTSVAFDLWNGRLTVGSPSSGEGIVEAFWGVDKVQDPATLKFSPVRKRMSTNELFVLDEGRDLMELAKRVGNITNSTLCTTWIGGHTGQSNASADRKRQLEARTYNMGLVTGLQYEYAGELLADTAQGFPQRFLWFGVIDPKMPPRSQDRDRTPIEPLRHSIHPDYLLGDPIGHWILSGDPLYPRRPDRIMHVVPSIADRVEEEWDALQRDEIQRDELDSHRGGAIGKLALVIAYLSGDNKVDEDIWDIATTLYEHSASVRDSLLEEQEERKRAQGRADTYRIAKERVETSPENHQKTRAEVSTRILGWIDAAAAEGKTLTAKDMRESKASQNVKPLISTVLGEMVDCKILVTVKDGKRTVYRRSDAA